MAWELAEQRKGVLELLKCKEKNIWVACWMWQAAVYIRVDIKMIRSYCGGVRLYCRQTYRMVLYADLFHSVHGLLLGGAGHLPQL